MKVNIFGVARSGTTALYSLVQEIMLDNHDKVDFIYEPFFWNKDVFNKRFEETIDHFKYIDSISAEAIYQHRQLPLFIDKPSQYSSNDYLIELLHPTDKTRSILLKMIRANGRFLLLNKICPACKFIFIIRNPLDSVNSAMHNFSYYGGEFHEDDYPRFIQEVNAIFNKSYTLESFQGHLNKNLAYWHYMNAFVFDNLMNLPFKPLVINYDNYAADYEQTTRRICDYLNVSFKPEYPKIAAKKKGYVTQVKKISEDDLSSVDPYLDIYFNLLERNNISTGKDKTDIIAGYSVTEEKSYVENKFYGLSTLTIQKKYRELEHKLTGQLKDSQGIITSKNKNIAELEKTANEKSRLIETYEENLKRNEILVAELGAQIKIHVRQISEKERLNAEQLATINQLKEKNSALDVELKSVVEKYSKASDENRKLKSEIQNHLMEINHLKALVRNRDAEIVTLKEIIRNKLEEISEQREEIRSILNSYSFRTGRVLLFPLRVIWEFINKHFRRVKE